ncbi:MAG: PAAR domain-containing protein [Kofleriaceae bacterium]
MPAQGRLGDKARAPLCAHGCPACPHPVIGPGVSGSTNVLVNSKPALRVDDKGIHAACCGPNQWRATQGSETVFINGRAAHRVGDATQHCGGRGFLVEGSPNVIVGGSTSSGVGRTDQPGWATEQAARDEALAAGADPHADTKAALGKAAKRGAGVVKKNHDHCNNGPTTVGPA